MMISTPPRITYAFKELSLEALKADLQTFSNQQKSDFLKHKDIAQLVSERSNYIDQLLMALWHDYHLDQCEQLTLLAVGGYGRQELHPLSDVDILILSQDPLPQLTEDKISEFITQLWDLKLDIGHSVRTLQQCLEIGSQDISVASNLQEARLLWGDETLFSMLNTGIHQPDFWPSAVFYQAKVNEQIQRHQRYHDTTYNLEPDIKSSPGGLRDIHTLSWIARRHFGATNLLEMSRFGFLTDAEYRELAECQNALWRIRFALHLELRRYDNRLTFGHQAAVAESLGFIGEGNCAVEMMMKEFYRTLRRVAELNKILLQLFKQAILPQGKKTVYANISKDFRLKGTLIEARKPVLFQARPETIIDLFLHIAKRPEIEGISAPTLRQLRTAHRRLNTFLMDSASARRKFMELIRHPNLLNKALELMHRHGVLASYFPQWSQIVGQMQFDLFHVYTVDEHTVRLLNNIKKFQLEENRTEHPICCEVYPRIIKKELLILAGIFHDIAKGRKGDHSELGSKEAYECCLLHGLSRPEANLVAWLVENHLLMSVTAQRRDIYDPDVIAEFAKIVRDEEHLDYLICLTVADISATNQDLWNSWKRTLLSELYYACQKALRRGLENSPDVRERIRHNQQLASAILRRKGFFPHQITTLWQRFKADYFLRHTHKQLAWHANAILKHDSTSPLVLLSKKATRGGTEVFIYCQDRPKLFSIAVSEFDKKNLSVHDARIMTSKDGYILDTFIVLDPNGNMIPLNRHISIINALKKSLQTPNPRHVTKRPPRQLQHFKVTTQVEFLPTKNGKKTLIELIALDMPGLLSDIGTVLSEQNLNLLAAKISTIGERAEDFFVLVNHQGQQLTQQEQDELKQALIQRINAPD